MHRSDIRHTAYGPEPRTRRRSNPSSAAVLALVSLLVLLITGCAAHEPITGIAEPARPDLAGLDTGAWDTSPFVAPAVYDDNHGRLLEAARLAEVMVDPVDIDPALRYGAATPLHSPGRAAALVPELPADSVRPYGLVTGFTVNRTDIKNSVPILGRSKALRLSVLRFFGDAAAAAEELATAARATPGTVAVSLPEYPQAYSQWKPDTPVITTFFAQGPFVVALYAMHPTTDLAALTTLVRTTLDEQVFLLDSFEPTTPDALTSLPQDPDRMLGRVLPEEPGSWTYPTVAAPLLSEGGPAGWVMSDSWGSGIVYGPRGSLHTVGPFLPKDGERQGEPSDRAVFLTNRVLLRFPSSHDARIRYNRVNNDNRAVGRLAEIPSPGQGVDITCFGNVEDKSDAVRTIRYSCFVLDGQYWAAVFAPDEQSVRQAAAAQYALLVNSR
ncbi:DUF7373 family lipoprotein [Nocardia sp. NPDC003963]